MNLPDFEISTDRSRIDPAVVHRLLADTYWAGSRPIGIVERMVANSACFAGYLQGEQIAFGRLVTDSATLAFLADMVVAPGFRGRGYGAELARTMLAYSDRCGVAVMLLNTRDARRFYEKLGFGGLDTTNRMMWRAASAAGLDAV